MSATDVPDARLRHRLIDLAGILDRAVRAGQHEDEFRQLHPKLSDTWAAPYQPSKQSASTGSTVFSSTRRSPAP